MAPHRRATITAAYPNRRRAPRRLKPAYYAGAAPGTYNITVELSGFATLVREGYQLVVGQSATFTMKLATLAETLTVTGESPLVATKQSDLGGRVRPRRSSRCRSAAATGSSW